MALVFVSYSRRDQAFVTQLVADLHKNNVPLWYDQESILAGQRWDDAIDQGLTDATHLILVMSPNSMASENVKDEIDTAMDSNKIIVPILLEDVKPPLRVRRIQRTDFRGDYQQALALLLRSLPTTGPVTAQIAAVQTTLATPAPSLGTATPAQAAAIIGTQVSQITDGYATAQAALTLIEAQASPGKAWRPVAYDEATDGTLADLASDSSDSMIALSAALVCAEVRSSYAVARLADKAAKGQLRALDALAAIREEVPNFPRGIDPDIKRRAFWLMTRKQLFKEPLALVARSVTAAIGYGTGIGMIIYAGYVQDVLVDTIVKTGTYTGVGFGITLGLLMGLAIVVTSALSERLVSWSLPGRIAAAWGVGTLLTTLAFVPLHLLYEQLEPVTLIASSLVFIAGFAISPALTRNTILRMVGGMSGVFAATYLSGQLLPDHSLALIYITGSALFYSLLLGLFAGVATYMPEAIGYFWQRMRRQAKTSSPIIPLL